MSHIHRLAGLATLEAFLLLATYLWVGTVDALLVAFAAMVFFAVIFVLTWPGVEFVSDPAGRVFGSLARYAFALVTWRPLAILAIAVGLSSAFYHWVGPTVREKLDSSGKFSEPPGNRVLYTTFAYDDKTGNYKAILEVAAKRVPIASPQIAINLGEAYDGSRVQYGFGASTGGTRLGKISFTREQELSWIGKPEPGRNVFYAKFPTGAITSKKSFYLHAEAAAPLMLKWCFVRAVTEDSGFMCFDSVEVASRPDPLMSSYPLCSELRKDGSQFILGTEEQQN